MEFIESLKDVAKKGFLGMFKGIEKEITRTVLKRMKRFEKYFIKQFTSITLILIAIVFLGISLAFLLIEFFEISKSIAFAAIGIIILLVGIILKLK
ncbi:hypothetical protein GOV12_05330 [Candidatus Pacearchaeota archaeon]|nr:hypothetical protein [Candidatus Pacearchaeota archaeon]